MPLGSTIAPTTYAPPEEEYIPPPQEEYVPPPEDQSLAALDGQVAGTTGATAPVQEAVPEGKVIYDSWEDMGGGPVPIDQPAPAPTSLASLDGQVAGTTTAAPELTQGQEPVPTLAEAGSQLAAAAGNIKDTVARGDVAALPGAIGGLKDEAVQSMASMGGDILPWRRVATNVVGEEAYERAQTGELQAQEENIPGFLEPVMELVGGNVINWQSQQDPAYLEQLRTEGYTSKSGVTFAPGDEAIWEAYVDTLTVPQRAFQDLTMDPTSALGGLAGVSKKVGPKIISKGLNVADDIAALGANQIIGGGLDVASAALKKTGILAPTKTQAALTESENIQEVAEGFGRTRREGGQVGSTTDATEIAPGVWQLGSADPLIPSLTYKTDGRQITSIVPDPSNLANVRPVTLGDQENLVNLMGRANPEQQAVLMNTGGRKLLLPDATVADPYLKTLQRSLPTTPTGSVRGVVPTPTSAPELLAIRSEINKAITNGNRPVVQLLAQTALRSGLLPPTTPRTTRGVIDAIGVVESARLGTPAIDPAVLTSVQGTLQRTLNERGLADIGVNLQRVATDLASGRPLPQVEGQYLNGIVTLATNLAGTADEATLALRLGDVLNHETVHALRHFQLFRDVEWRSLAAMATSSKVRGDAKNFLEEVTERYEAAFARGDIPTRPTSEALVEEAVAEMFRAYVRGDLVATDVQRTLLQKIAEFFSAMAQSIRGARPAQVLQNIESGKIGGRRRPATISVMGEAQTAYRRNMSEAPIVRTTAFPDPTDPRAWNAHNDGDYGKGWALAAREPGAAHTVLTDLTDDILNRVDPETGLPKFDRVQKLISGEERLSGVNQQIWDQSFLRRNGGGPAIMADQINQAASLTWRDRVWYEKTVQDFKTHYDLPGNTEAKTYNVTSATSGQTQPRSNVGRTLAIISNWLRGADDFTPVGGNTGVRAALLGSELIGTDKFGSFARTFLYLAGLTDEIPKATIDLQMMKVFGMDNVEGTAANSILGSEPQLYDFFDAYIEGVRDLLNSELGPGDVPWQTWQVQAVLWSGVRQTLGVQEFQAADDAGIWFKEAANWMRQQGIIGPGQKVTAESLMDPRVVEKYGETNTFWQDAPWMTVESRTLNTPEGAAAGEVFERLFAIPINQLAEVDPALAQSVSRAITVYRGNERRALKGISTGSSSPVQNLLRGITGRGGLTTTLARSDALGAYEGQIGVNMRLPMRSADVGWIQGGGGTERLIYSDSQIRQMLAFTNLGLDQSAAAASHFRAARLGEHNTWTVRIPTASKVEGNVHLEQALARFTNDVGWPTSIHYDPSGILVDLHVFDPGGLPPVEQIIEAESRHLRDAFGAEGTVIPRYRSDYFLEAKDYRQPIRSAFDEVVNPLVLHMENHVAALRKKTGKNAKPEALAASEAALSQLKQARNILYTDDVTADSVTRTIQEVKESLGSYQSAGAGRTTGAGITAAKRLNSLEQGWNGLREAAARRNADDADFARTKAKLAERAERSTIFGPESATPAPGRVDEPKPPGLPQETAVGTKYSVAKFQGHHGSPKTDLTVLSPDPPVRQHRTASTLLGSFVTGDEYLAQEYASILGRREGTGGRVYHADVELQKPYHMSGSDFVARFEWEDWGARDDALTFKERLVANGHDGIIAWDGDPRIMPDGSVDVSDPTKLREVVLFKELPVYRVSKGQTGTPLYTGAPVVDGVYKRGSVQEYMNTIIPDQDRAVLDVSYTFGGKTETAWQRFVKEQDTAQSMRDLAIRQQAGVALTTREQGQLDRFVNQLRSEGIPNASLADWSDEAVDKLAAKRTRKFVEQAKGLRNAAGETIDPGYYKGIAGKALKAYDNFAGYRRTMSLYSTVRGPSYVLMQAIGNAITLGIANPSALKYYSPIEQRRIVQNAREKGVDPFVATLRSDVGLGRSESLGGSRDQLAMGNQANKTFFEKSTNPVVKGIGKIVANPAIKENADGFDTLLRHAAYRSAFEPGHRALVQGLPDRAAATLAEFVARSGVPSPVRGSDFAQAVRDLGPRFTGAELRTALVNAVGGNDAVVARAAERIARDYVNDIRTLDKAAIANVNRIGFDFADTRADAVLSRLFMFHYWLSRASVLYLREAAANPYQMQLWARAMNAGNRRAEEGIPEWQKNFQEFMTTPAGITGLWNPAYLVGTYLFMREDQEAMPWEDLTKLGQGLQTGFVSNLMMNPLLQGAIYVLGAGGSDFNPPDILGTGKWTGDINTWLEKANRDVATFYATEKGNPKVVPNLDSRTLLSWVADQITQRGWENDFFGMAPVNGYDPNASEQANLSWLIHDQVLTQNPELNDGTQESAELVASMVEEALANPDSPLYQAAADNLVGMLTAGPGSGQGNVALDVAGYYGRMVLPFGVTTQVTSRREKQIRGNRDEKTALDTEMGYVDDATPEKQSFDIGYDAVRSAWDPAATQIKDINKGIKSGNLPMDAIMIEGKAWTSEELQTLPQADRDTLARFWLTYPQEQLGGRTGQQILDDAYAAEDVALTENPQIADYWALSDYMEDYPGGALAGIQDTAAVNSNYRRFLEQLPSGLTENEYVEEATSVNAYGALTGQKFSRYDANPMGAGKGQVAGLAPGESLGEYQARQEDDQYISKREDVEAGLATYDKATTILRGYDELWGMAPGTLEAQYAAEIAGGGYASDQIYGLLKDGGMTSEEIRPRTDEDKAAPVTWYLKWAVENGVTPGQDVARYVDEDNRRYLGGKVADINAGIYSDPDPAEDNVEATSLDPTTGEPVGDSPIYVPPGKSDQWWTPVGNALGAGADTLGKLFGGDGPKLNSQPSEEAVAVPAGQTYQGGLVEGQEISSLASEYVGVPYVHEFPTANDDPWQTGWDCSSFVKWLADVNGISDNQYPNQPGYVGGGVPTGSHYQYTWVLANDRVVTEDQLQPGDIIFFNTDPENANCDPANWNGCMDNDADHVSVYLGPDETGRPQIIHAAAPGVGTVYDYLDTYPYPVLDYARIV